MNKKPRIYTDQSGAGDLQIYELCRTEMSITKRLIL